MEKILSSFLTILFLTLFSNTLADDAPLYSLPGGSVMPVDNDDIRMVSETIDFYLSGDSYDVEVNYNFLNEGKTQEILLGFPSGMDESHAYTNFRTYVNGKEVKIETIPGDWSLLESESSFEDHYSYVPMGGLLYYKGNAFDAFRAKFTTGDTVKIKNTYSAGYVCAGYHCDKGYAFWYILETGRYWKGKIDEVKVRVNTDLISKADTFDMTFNYYNEFEQVFKDVEPDFNLFYYLDKVNKNVPVASSTLHESGDIDYTTYNLRDDDPTTAWVEGVDGYGEGQTLSFYSDDCEYCECPDSISRIGIINGYAKSDATFKNNSRVKDFEIMTTEVVTEEAYRSDNGYYNVELHPGDPSCDDSYHANKIYRFTMKDTKDEQFFSFGGKKAILNMTLTIKSVYKGAKYKDTAISEILFYGD